MSQLKGPAVLVEYQDLFTSTTNANYMDLGGTATTGDGRFYRFVLAGATALVPGTLLQSPAEVTANQNLAVAAAAIGDTTVTTTTTLTATLNQYAGGYMAVTVTPGQGYIYKIKANPAVTTAALAITLEDPIQVALTTASRIDLYPSPYTSVIINPSTATSAPQGVAIYPVTAAQYGWIQVSGQTNVLADGAVVVGTTVVASNATAGAVEAFTGVQAVVGVALTGIATTEYGLIDLHLF